MRTMLRKTIARLSDAALHELGDAAQTRLDNDDTYTKSHRILYMVEREQDARALWDHPDARVRDAMGNTRA